MKYKNNQFREKDLHLRKKFLIYKIINLIRIGNSKRKDIPIFGIFYNILISNRKLN